MLYNVYIKHNDGSLQSFTKLTEKKAKELKKRFRRAFMNLLIDAIEITDENHQVVYSIQVSRRQKTNRLPLVQLGVNCEFPKPNLRGNIMLNLKYNDEVYNIDDPDEADGLIDNVLSDLNDDILANLWNDWADKKGYSEEHIFCMSELEDYLMMTDTTAYDVIVGDVIDFDCFSHREDYFIDSMYGLRSSDSPWDLVDFDDYPEFYEHMKELIEADPYKYDCEEVDEVDDEESVE